MESKNSFTINGKKLSEIKQMMKRKRPKITKLDIEKLFQQSIELTQIQKRLMTENQILQKECHRVEQNKANRQNFISAVQELVREKAEEVSMRGNQQSSWLVLNLNKKIYDLKNKINQKQNTIKTLELTKQNQQLKREEIKIKCLKEVLSISNKENFVDGQNENEDNESLKQFFWIQNFLQQEKVKLAELQLVLQQQERETNKIMNELAIKKTQLKNIKEMQNQYVEAQNNYQEQKKRKEKTLLNKKNLICDLEKKKEDEEKKLYNLKEKHVEIGKEEDKKIFNMIQKLKNLEQVYEKVQREDKKTQFLNSTKIINKKVKEEWVRRITVEEISLIAKNLNYSLTLKKVSQEEWLQILFKDHKSQYSIIELMKKFSEYPFSLAHEEQKMLARYAIEDNDTGKVVEDMKKTQKTPIIRSILIKIIGETTIYTEQKIEELNQSLGEKLKKFGSLIKQGIHNKEVGKIWITRQQLQQGIQNAQLEISQQEIEFIMVYLFSWARDIEKLQISKIRSFKELGVNWIK